MLSRRRFMDTESSHSLYRKIPLEYPRARVELQVLDDSTDETTYIAQRVVEEMRNEQFAVQYLHRTDRQGYKAGALNAGLNVARDEFMGPLSA